MAADCSGPITPRVTSVSPEGEAFVQSFTNLQDFAQSSAGGPALPVLWNDDYNGPVTQAGISFTQMNFGTGATSAVWCYVLAVHKAKNVLKSQELLPILSPRNVALVQNPVFAKVILNLFRCVATK